MSRTSVFTKYKVTLDDGTRCDYDESSAGVAINRALHDNPGRKVIACRSGMSDGECSDARAAGTKGAIAGQINYDIPPHAAITASQAKAAKIHKGPKRGDETVPMFSEKVMSGRM